MNGALTTQLERARAADGELERVALAGARTLGAGQGLTTLLCGLAMWGALLVGVSAVHAGTLAGVLLAVLALVPLATLELVTGLPTATQTLARVRGSAARVFEVADARPSVVEPHGPPCPCRRRRTGFACAGCAPGTHRRPLGARWRRPRPRARAPRRRGGRKRRGQVDARRSTAAISPLPGRLGHARRRPIDRLAGDAYRRVVGLVAQDAHIFDTTIAENLLLARREASAQEVGGALARAGLGDWVESLPEGPGDRGRRARRADLRRSGQRLAVARALLADFPVLILDEPAEHLETAAADALVADLLSGTRASAILLITHRLAGLQAADEVLVLDRGRVLERGTHVELAAAGGRYGELWRRERGY